MPSDIKPADRRKKRLPQDYYDTIRNLDWYVFSKDNPVPSTKQTVRETVARLAALAGVTPEEYPADVAEGWPEVCTIKAAARLYHFEMEEGDARRAEWSRLFDGLRSLASVSVELGRTKRLLADAAKKPGEAQALKPRTARTDVKDDIWEAFGVPAGADVHFEEIFDPRPGELVAVEEKAGDLKSWEGFGRVTEAGEETVWVEERDGEQYGYDRPDYNFFRVTEYTVKPKRPDPAASYTSDPEQMRQRKLKQLRARLDKIDPDDLTNCSARLSLEKQIYDLEHPPNLDDWSAWEEKEERAK